MDHIHNETVLNFLKAHKDDSGIRGFLKDQEREIKQINDALNEDYKDYLDYLERNIGDDADYTMEELEALLKPELQAKLSQTRGIYVSKEKPFCEPNGRQ